MSAYDPRDPNWMAEQRRLLGRTLSSSHLAPSIHDPTSNPSSHGVTQPSVRTGAVHTGARPLYEAQQPEPWEGQIPKAPVPPNMDPIFQGLHERAPSHTPSVPRVHSAPAPKEQDPLTEALNLGRGGEVAPSSQEDPAPQVTALNPRVLDEALSMNGLTKQLQALKDSNQHNESLAVVAEKLGGAKLAQAARALSTIEDALGYSPDSVHNLRRDLADRVRFLAQKKLDREAFSQLRMVLPGMY